MTLGPLVPMSALRRMVRDPLGHFLVGGAVLFLWYGLAGDPRPDGRGTIHIDEYEVQRLAALFQAQWRRPPAGDELARLLADRVREEVFYREALALNLDQNDVLVRRRLAEKLELALVDVAALVKPEEGELRRYYERHRERYWQPAELSLTHRFWSAGREAASAEAVASAALSRLRAGEVVDDDSFHAPKTQRAVTADRLVRIFGEAFQEAVVAAAAVNGGDDTWFGPVPSAYGFHLVRVETFVPPRQQALAEVRDRVLADWRREYVDAEEERRYREMLGRYDVTVATGGTGDLEERAGQETE